MDEFHKSYYYTIYILYYLQMGLMKKQRSSFFKRSFIPLPYLLIFFRIIITIIISVNYWRGKSLLAVLLYGESELDICVVCAALSIDTCFCL